MNYKKLLEYIKYIGVKHSLINTCMEGDNIYQVNHTDVVYPLVYITPQPHIIDNPISTFNFVFYYIDRLLEDKSNRIDIHSAGLKSLNDMMLDIDMLNNTETNRPYNSTVFSEKFSDECAGVWFEVSIQSYNPNNECSMLNDDSVFIYSEQLGGLQSENGGDIITE